MTENTNAEEVRAKYRAIIDEYFKESMADIKKYAGWSSEEVESVKEISDFYQSRDEKVITVNDIQLVYSFISVLAYQTYFSFFYIDRAMRNMKEITHLILEIPLTLIEGALPEVVKLLDEKLEAQKKELEKLREEGVTVGLESYEKIEKGLELLVKQHEEAVKASRKMVV